SGASEAGRGGGGHRGRRIREPGGWRGELSRAGEANLAEGGELGNCPGSRSAGGPQRRQFDTAQLSLRVSRPAGGDELTCRAEPFRGTRHPDELGDPGQLLFMITEQRFVLQVHPVSWRQLTKRGDTNALEFRPYLAKGAQCHRIRHETLFIEWRDE